jgi:anti-sigma factor RsiW
MARIIRLHDDENHWELQRLLPWYVTGRLDKAEHDRVEAHLQTCEECQDEVRFERTLAQSVKDLPLDAEVGWRRLERRLKAEPQQEPGRVAPGAGVIRTGVQWGGWAVAACALVAAGVTVMARAPQKLQPQQQQAASGQYHVLGAAHSVAPGNMVVIFRPETPERAIRGELTAVNARIVDGPTAADAYVLTVPAAQRPDALAKLRSQPNIVLAEPVDPGAAP